MPLQKYKTQLKEELFFLKRPAAIELFINESGNKLHNTIQR